MKQRLLTAAMLLAATIAAWAQNWTAPIDPATGTDPVDGGTYYIRNVGCGQYVTGANSWAMQISVSTNGTPYFSVVAEAASDESGNVGFRLKMNGTFYFTGDHDRVNYEVSNKYLFRDSEASGFVDLGSQARNAIWVLTKDANGYYRIQSTDEGGLFPDAALQYAYARDAGQAVEFNRTETSVSDVSYLEWEFVPSSVDLADIELYGARKQLYDALQRAYSLDVDYASASTIYENSSDVDAINAAANDLVARINQSLEENGVYIETDYTSHLGITAAAWKGSSSLCATRFAPAITTKDGRTAQLAENYQGNVNATGDLMTQTVTGLANGTYRVSIYANAFYTSGRGFDSDMSDGAEDVCYVFAGSGDNRVQKFITAHIATSTTENDLRTLENVQVTDGTLVVGLGKAKAGTNWHTIQVYEITAMVDGGELLAATVAEASDIYPIGDSPAWYTQLTQTVDEYNRTYDTGAEYKEAIDAISTAMARARQYQPLATILAKGENFKMRLAAYEAGAAAIDAYDNAIYSVNAAYASLTVSDFDAAIATVKEAFPLLGKVGTDMTSAIENPEVNGIDGWNYDLPVGGNGPLLRNQSFEYWAGNSANRAAASFNYYQELTGLPNGKYIVSAEMFNSLNGEGGSYTTFAPTSGLYATSGGKTVSALVDEDSDTFGFYLTEPITVTDGTLTIGVKNFSTPMAARWFVADNFSLYLVEPQSQEEEAYIRALSSVSDGDSYYIYAQGEDGKKYYLDSNGYLNDTKSAGTMFFFSAVQVSGTKYETGWNLGYRFTNPTLSNGSTGTIENQGHINNGDYNRDTWERQVLFEKDGAFAIRATNADSENWGANTYWDIFEYDDLIEAGYSLSPAYVWHLDDGSEPEYDYTERKAQVAGVTGEEGGMDVTEWIVNPTPVASSEGWYATGGTYDEALNVAEFWRISGASLSQTVNLPAGYYILTAQAFTRTGMEATLSMTVGENVSSTAIATVDQSEANSRTQAQAYYDAGNGINEVRFYVAEDSPATITLQADSTTGDHWMTWRGFTLRYFGADGFAAYDRWLIADLRNDAIDLSAQKMSANMLAGLVEAVEATEDDVLEKADAATLTALRNRLESTIAAAASSIAEYVTFNEYVADAATLASSDLAKALGDEAYAAAQAKLAEMEEAYEAGSVEGEAIEAYRYAVRDILRAAVSPETVTEGLDLTFMIDNNHFTEGQYGPNASWTYYGTAESTPGWTVNSGSIKELRPQTHNIEAFHQPFDFSQTLHNMPAGVYDLTLQGFVRHDNAEVTDKTYLYAGQSTRSIMLNTDQWRSEPLYYEGVEPRGDRNYDVTRVLEDGTTCWVDNGMTGSYYWFQTVNPDAAEQGGQEGDCYYTNHLKVVLAADGDFTIGLHSDTDTDWIIWDNFQLKYLGNLASQYTESIYEKLDALKDEIAACPMPTANISQQLYLTMSEQADEAISAGDEEDCQQVIADLDAAIAGIREVNALADTLTGKVSTYSQNIYRRHSTDRSIDDLLVSADQYVGRQAVFADAAAIRQFIGELDAAYAAFEAAEFDAAELQTKSDVLANKLNENVFSDDLYEEIANKLTEVAYVEYDNDIDLKASIDSLQTLSEKIDAYHAEVAALVEDLPVGKDLTAVLVNTQYSLGEVGWTAQNMFQKGSASMGCVITSSYTNNDITIETFAESWNGGQPVNDASIRQTTRIELPAGTYALDADIITSTANDELVNGVYMFIERTDAETGETSLVKQSIRVNGGLPGHCQMVINHEGGRLTFGVCYESTNATWVGIDNWKLSVATAPDAGDLAILAQAYEQMKGTKGDVLGWNIQTNPTGLTGVTYAEGHVTAIDLAGYGLDGQFPSALLLLPQIEKIELQNNALQGSIDASMAALAQAAGTQTPVSTLKKLNISNNRLTGNAGLIGAVCTQMTQLLAAGNRITGLMPALPETIDQNDLTQFDLRNQTIDYTMQFDMTQPDLQTFIAATPTIVTYPLLQQAGDIVAMRLRTPEQDVTGTYNSALLQLTADGAIISGLDHEYRGELTADFEVTLLDGPVAGSTLTARLTFAPGDANLSGAVNIYDLQTDVNYIFGDKVEQFNFTAADLYKDERINVQDVVKLVDVILAGESTPDNNSIPVGNDVTQSMRQNSEGDVKDIQHTRVRAFINNVEEEEPEAYIFWRGNELVLQSSQPVAAADIRVSSPADVDWRLTQMGFSVSQKRSAGLSRAVAYSLSGMEIPAGETILATTTGNSADVESVLLSDRKAKPIRTVRQTPLPTAIDELMAAEGNWTLVSADGKVISRGNGLSEWQTARRRLAAGVYVLTGSANKSQKVSIK